MSNIPGKGLIELQQVAGKTAITQCRANSPLKLLTPKGTGDYASVFTSTYGGGLVGGDEIALEVRAGPGTRMMLTTQASTKIYRSEKKVCRQVLKVTAEKGSVVVSVPDPIVCFGGAEFCQEQQYHLNGEASLMMLDWFTSGRRARGERWMFDRYQSSTEIVVDDKMVFRDVLLLDPVDGAIGGEMRMGKIDCFATAVVIGPGMRDISRKVLGRVAAQPPGGFSKVIVSASAIPGGAVVRAAGVELEELGRCMKELFTGLKAVLGADPWRRKV